MNKKRMLGETWEGLTDDEKTEAIIMTSEEEDPIPADAAKVARTGKDQSKPEAEGTLKRRIKMIKEKAKDQLHTFCRKVMRGNKKDKTRGNII